MTNDAHASFQIFRLSAVSRLSYLLRIVPHSITHDAFTAYDALEVWGLVSIIACDDAAVAGLPTLKEVDHGPCICRNETYRGHETLRQDQLPTREGGLGLIGSGSIKGAAYIVAAKRWSWDVQLQLLSKGTSRIFSGGYLGTP